MNLSYDLAANRPDLHRSLVEEDFDVPIYLDTEQVGTARLKRTAKKIEMELADSLYCRLATGEVRITFTRETVPESEVEHGRNQRLVEIRLLKNH